MAKYFVKAFGVAGTLLAIPDLNPGTGSVSYEEGFGIDYQLPFPSDPSALPIPRAQFNELMFDTTGAIQQYQQNGVPDFITTADNLGVPYPYPIYARVRYNPGGGVQIYENQVAGNTTLPTDPSWRVISGGTVPAGTMIAYAGNTVPAGWLLCDGSLVNRATFSVLFTAIGVLWGAGDGSITFSLPNMTRRIPMGFGGTATTPPGGISNTVGSYGGQESVVLTLPQIPSHNHAGTHVDIGQGLYAGGGGAAFNNTLNTPVARAVSVTAEGGGLGHPNVQPAAIVKWIIKF